MNTLPKELELLEFTGDLFNKINLSDSYLIACQHVLPSFYYLLKTLILKGLPVENISVIGKCYSSSRLTYQMIKNKNIYISELSFAYNSHISFDEQFKEYLHQFIKKILPAINLLKNKRIIILDDGGELISSLQYYLDDYDNIMGVEQTSSGYHKLCDQSIPFPIINVARSYAKLNFESPHIALSIANRLTQSMNIADKSILIIGKGAIGRALENNLKQFSKIDFYDHQDNINLLKEIELSKYDLIIGATGNTVIDSTLYPHLKKNVSLISVSSSDREFSASSLRKSVAFNTDCHRSMQVDHIKLINSGFPLNFYGSMFDNVLLEEIQLTFSLLLAGICQHRPNNTGFIDLDRNIQQAILNKYFLLNKQYRIDCVQ